MIAALSSGSHRRGLTIALLLLMTGLGVAMVFHLLSEVRGHDLRGAIRAITPGAIAGALALTILSYLSLTLYDHMALRIIGKQIAWRTAALASFCSYTLSHNLGLSLLTGGSARMRIYGAAGLGPGDVARVIASASLSFWSGVVTMAALFLAVDPMPVAIKAFPIGASVLQLLGFCLLGGVAVALAGLRRAPYPVRLFGWTLMLPSRGQAAAQIGIACIDLTLSSGALFVLLPHSAMALFPAFFLAYTLGIIVALISHVPGGVGLFEAVMLATVPQVARPSLFAALLAYRVVYYLLPLAAAAFLIILHERHAWQSPVRRVLSGAESLGREIAPAVLAMLVAAGGIVLLVSGSLPAIPARFRAVSSILPMPFVEASHLAASMIGAMLVLLGSGLYRRQDGAFWLTRLLLLAGAAFSLMKGLDYEEAAVLIVITVLLQWSRPAFYRKTSLTSAMLAPGWIAALAVAIGISVWIGFFAFKHVDYQNELWWQFGRHHDASRFLRAAVATGVLLVWAAVWQLLRPASPSAWPVVSTSPSEQALAAASKTDAFLSLTGDKLFLTSPSGRAFLMYQIQGHSWIVMGDPVGDPSEWGSLLWELRERAGAAQGRLLLYQLSLDALPLAVDLSLSLVKYGEEARVDLTSFTIDGPKGKPFRHALRRAEGECVTFEIVPAADIGPLLDEMEAVSRRWLEAKGSTEKAFSVGRFDRAYLRRFDCALVRHEGRIIAFANIWATTDHGELSVDLMRHDAVMPAGMMDFLFCRLMLWGQSQGYRWFTLGMAPLSGLEARRLSPIWVKAGALIFKHGGSLYGFKGLRAYKAKFTPSWEPRFIAGPQGLSMLRAMLDLQRLIDGGPRSAACRMRSAGRRLSDVR